MSSQPKVAAFGSWKSPITADLLSGKGISLLELGVNKSADKIYCVEGRPAEGGRSCIVEHSEHGVKDILPKEYSARTGIYEYGGAAFTLSSAGELIFADWETKGVFSLAPETGETHRLTESDPKVNYADFNVHPTNCQWVLAIREDHSIPGVEHTIVAIDASKKTTLPVVQGADFYSHPQYSPDGKRLCWMQWNHPDMPWTGTELYVAAWQDGKVGEPTFVAGKAEVESISQPRWGPDGTLFFVSDRSGYWQLYRYRNGGSRAEAIQLKGLEDAELAGPEWWLGSCTYVSLTADKLIATYTKDAADRLAVIDVQSGSWTDPHFPLVEIRNNAIRRVSDTTFVVIGSTLTAPAALYRLDIMDPSKVKVLKTSMEVDIPSSLYSEAQHISFPRVYGDDKKGEGHALFLPPKNPEYQAEVGNLPPLIVYIHGGPTGHEGPGLSLFRQYYTSRGYAFVAVNYAGSTGYGRAYRDRLYGTWGISDVADAASCVTHLASASLIDRSRVGITGGSAGGYSVLQSLCVYPDVWAGGVSLYGISDCKALIDDTHKFESRYIGKLLCDDRLSTEEKEKIYRDRSPLYHADNITAAVLLLQGSDDKIVPPNQAWDIEKAIKKNGGEAKVIIFDGEGHGFIQGKNVKTAVEEEEKWWVKTLLSSYL